METDREHLFSEITKTATKYQIECNKHLLSLELGERLQKTVKAKSDIESYFSVSGVSTLIMNALG